MATLGIETALDQAIEKCLNGGGVLGRALDDARRMLRSAQFHACTPEHRDPVLLAHA